MTILVDTDRTFNPRHLGSLSQPTTSSSVSCPRAESREVKRLARSLKRAPVQARLAGLYRELGEWTKAAQVEGCCSIWAAGYRRRSGERAVAPVNHCHASRLCPNCAEQRSRRAAARFGPIIRFYERNGYVCRFLTLTIKSIPTLSRRALSDLFSSWVKLRRRKLFKDCIGTLAALEFTRTEAGWHPHLHILLLSPKATGYIPQDKISEAWEEITGGSFIVDIRKADEDSLVELLKYAVKGSDIKTADELREAEEAMRGFRAIRATGVLRGIEPLLEDLAGDDVDDEDDFVVVAYFDRDDPVLMLWLMGMLSEEELRRRAGEKWRGT